MLRHLTPEALLQADSESSVSLFHSQHFARLRNCGTFSTLVALAVWDSYHILPATLDVRNLTLPPVLGTAWLLPGPARCQVLRVVRRCFKNCSHAAVLHVL